MRSVDRPIAAAPWAVNIRSVGREANALIRRVTPRFGGFLTEFFLSSTSFLLKAASLFFGPALLF
ncbi:MAG: hypothetical protein ACRDJG_02420 [Actinomycetota bacterium]